jgi:hypothetical protein
MIASAPLQPVIIAPREVVSSSATVAVDEACDVCEHPRELHDAIGRRFCAATISNALTRGCICRMP